MWKTPLKMRVGTHFGELAGRSNRLFGEILQLMAKREIGNAREVRHHLRLPLGQVSVKVGNGLDASKIVFEGDMLVGGVGVFVGQTKTDEHARHFKGVVHLSDEG